MSIRQCFAALLTALFTVLAVPAYAAVDVNKATQADLETVRGIGPGLSGKIMAARQQGPFKDWSDLVDRVSGVGPGNAARFSQAGLTVAGAAYAASPAAAPADKPAAESRRKATREASAEAGAGSGATAAATSATTTAAAANTAPKRKTAD